MKSLLRRLYIRIRREFRLIEDAMQSTRRSRGGMKRRIWLFLTDYRLGRKTSWTDGNISSSFDGITITGINPPSLRYLVREVFIDEAYAVRFDSSSPVIIDCGANVGAATLYFKQHFPSASVFCVEPNPGAFEILEKNVHSNRLSNVELIQAAAGKSRSTTPLYIDDESGGLCSSTIECRGGGRAICVDTIALSKLVIRCRPDLVKMDIEGGEEDIVRELRDADCLSKVPQYLIEYHHRIGGSQSRLAGFLQMFEDHGFNYALRAGKQKADGFQDIMIHATRAVPPLYK